MVVTQGSEVTRSEAGAAAIAAAEAFVPELAERAAEFDRARQLPQDIADRLARAGLYRLCAPAAVGGVDVGVRTMCEVVERLAQGSASAAWCAFIASTSHLNMAGATPDFRAAVADDPALIMAGVFSTSGTAVAEQRDGVDGYVVNGHWRWGSGCHNAHWISGALTEVDQSGEPISASPISRLFFRPDEVEILDNWHVSGLRGSGSSDFVVHDAWLPAERVITGPTGAGLGEHPIFRFPLFGVLGTPIGAIAMGMAQACLDEVADVAQTKVPNSSRRTLASRPLVHLDFATAHTELRAARALFYTVIDEAWERALGAGPTLEDRVAIRTANNHAVTTAASVIDRMYRIAGGTSVYESSPLQRHFRDVHTATQHMMVADSVMELAGRVLLGVDTDGRGL
ncbi:MAG: acyl-CoA dehydrogenase family protein [Actinomycetota bacterium]